MTSDPQQMLKSLNEHKTAKIVINRTKTHETSDSFNQLLTQDCTNIQGKKVSERKDNIICRSHDGNYKRVPGAAHMLDNSALFKKTKYDTSLADFFLLD